MTESAAAGAAALPDGRARGSTIATAIRTTMERAISAVRIVSAIYCIAIYARHSTEVPRPVLGWAVMAAIALWTAFAVWVQLIRRTRRPSGAAADPAWAAAPERGRLSWLSVHGGRFALLDVIVVLILTLATILVQSPAQRAGEIPTLTTVWAVCPALTAGARRGVIAGLAAATVQGLGSIIVRDGADATTFSNIIMLMLAGAATGYLAQLASRAEAEAVAAAAAAAAERAAVSERERLARDIHDGVLQVLSLVHRRGLELGGEAAELGRLAGEQETILRGLVSRPAPELGQEETDLALACGSLRARGVTVSVPAHPVLVDPAVAGALLAAARAALDNVAKHAGPSAQAWVLLEDDGDSLVLSIRDDGVGVTADRLDEAAGEYRMGVAQSIVARVAELGGSAAVGPAIGGGTEVEMTIPAALARRG